MRQLGVGVSFGQERQFELKRGECLGIDQPQQRREDYAAENAQWVEQAG